MSRPALLDKLMQAGKWLFKPDLVPVDGTTLKRNGTDISVAIDALARSGGGLAVDAKTGRLYVDFSLVPDDQMQAIVLAMVQQGGGLAVDRAGKLYVDFASMPTDKFDAMLKSIRVPVWLSRNLTVYVATTGSDTLDEGRGLSPSKPFVTLQAALNYVSTTYNLYKYNCIIDVAAGDYGISNINLPSYSTTTGTIIITGQDQDSPSSVNIGRVYNRFGSYYTLRDMTIKPGNSPTYYQAVYCTSGTIDLINVILDISETVVDNGSLTAITTEDSGKVRIYATQSLERKSGITIKIGAVAMRSIIIASGGNIQYSADISIEGSGTMRDATVVASTGGVLHRSVSSFVNPGRLPVVAATGTISGRRYDVSSNGIINSNGGGTDFFPGTVEGRSRTGGQYV